MKVRIYTCFIRRLFLKNRLKQMKFYFKKTDQEKYWQKHIDDENKQELKNIKRFCKFRFLRYSFIDDSMDRSSNYRNNFLKLQKGIFGSNIYLCAYCGRFLTKNKVCVDHIIPIYKAKNQKFYKRLLFFRHIKNVNDIRNLAPSCNKCNSRKSADGGLWVIKGLLGRSSMFTLVKEIILLCIGSVALYELYFFIKGNISCELITLITDFCMYIKEILLAQLL